ncbi:MAG: cytochrome c oxidase subunit 3 family protein [Gammaproteobacteria bacterium]|nr:cytochrome c oxidase subunit 3 family protein [Gammaproteobacteria bacterium]
MAIGEALSLQLSPANIAEPAPGRIPGNMAIWVAIFSEMTEFALMFVVYFIAKVHYPEEFAMGQEKLNTLAGTLNTLVLISSSYFVAKSVQSIRIDRVKSAVRWMWMALAMGGLYLAIKYWEFNWNSAHGYEVETDIFFTVYYYMTFNHFLHVGWGSGALLWGIYRLKSGAYSSAQHEGLETIASYWHMIDLAWIVIFPLLYVLG